jgi:hypothetical protein
MASDPTELDLVRFAHLEQPSPQIGIHGALLVCAPPIPLPPRDRPAVHDGVDQILRIAVERDLAGLLQHFESLDRREDLDPVISRHPEAAARFRAFSRMEQDHAVSARPWIRITAAVRVDFSVLQGIHDRPGNYERR